MANEIKYNKLVRDLIPDIIEQAGKKHKIHIANNDEYISALYSKVNEELKEFIENPSEEEMADLLEVLENIREHHQLDYDEVIQIKNDKNKKRGSFKKKIILEKVTEQ